MDGEIRFPHRFRALAGVAVWSEEGDLCAFGHGLWIELRAPTAG